MTSSIYIIHIASDAQWVGNLVEFLRASSSTTLDIAASSSPEDTINHQKTVSDDLRSKLYQADTILTIVSIDTLSDPQFNLELGAALALSRPIIALIDPRLSNKNLPRWIQELSTKTIDSPQAAIELARKICSEYAESKPQATALRRLFGGTFVDDEIQDSRDTQTEHSESDTLQGIPAVLPDATPPGSNESSKYPSSLEAFNAGIAISDCLYHRNEGGDFASELDKPFGTFFNSLGGNWANLRRLGDLEVYSEAIENLLNTLPPEKDRIVHWYKLGLHLSNMLNVAGSSPLEDPQRLAEVQEQWKRALEAFRLSAKAANVPPQDIEGVQHMLENFVRSESEKDYSNIAKSREILRQHAKNALPSEKNPKFH